MRSAAQNLRTAVAMAVDSKSRAALFRGFCSPFCSSLPPPVLQLSDRIKADGGAAPTITPTPPPDLPPPCDQNAAGEAAWLEGLELGDSRLLTDLRCGELVKYSNPANDSEIISLADYCVQQISQIQDSQYKLVKIVEAAGSLVAGIRFRITLELSNQDGSLRKYHFDVWERPWLKLRELLSWHPVN